MRSGWWRSMSAAALLLWGGLQVASAMEPIRIGAFLTLTGPSASLGDPELKTLRSYIADLNAKGGVIGRTIELHDCDTGGNAQQAIACVKRLIEQDRVDLLIGGSTTGDTMAVIPAVEQARISLISLAGGIEIIDPVKHWVFKTPHTDRMAVAKIYANLRKRGLTKVALITGDGGFDQSGRAQLHQLAPQYGIAIVADETYGNQDADMTAQLARIKASNAQAIINFGFGQAPAVVTRDAKQLGITLPLYQSHGVVSQSFIEQAGAAAEGVRLPAAALVVAEQLPDANPQKPVLLAYKRRYESQYGPVSTFGGHAYDGLMIAVAAIRRAGDVDKAKLRDEIERTSGLIGVAGVFEMTPEDHVGLNADAFRMVEIHNGSWRLLP